MENEKKESQPEDDVGLLSDKQTIIKLPYPPQQKEYYEGNSDSGFEIGYAADCFDC